MYNLTLSILKSSRTKNIHFLLIICLPLVSFSQAPFHPPATEKKPVVDTLHGFLLTDNYRWLEDKTDQRVIEWTKAQHDCTVEYMKSTQKEHPGLRDEVTAYIDLDYEGPLHKEGKRVFQTIKKRATSNIPSIRSWTGKKS